MSRKPGDIDIRNRQPISSGTLHAIEIAIEEQLQSASGRCSVAWMEAADCARQLRDLTEQDGRLVVYVFEHPDIRHNDMAQEFDISEATLSALMNRIKSRVVPVLGEGRKPYEPSGGF